MCILLNVGSYFFKTCPNTRSETTKLCHFMFCFLHFSETFNRAGQCQNVKTFWNLFFQQVLKSGKFWAMRKKITVPDFKVNLLNSFYWLEIFFIIQWRSSFRKIPDFTKIFWLFQNFSKMPLDLPNCFLLWSINDAAAAELSVSIIFCEGGDYHLAHSTRRQGQFILKSNHFPAFICLVVPLNICYP